MENTFYTFFLNLIKSYLLVLNQYSSIFLLFTCHILDELFLCVVDDIEHHNHFSHQNKFLLYEDLRITLLRINIYVLKLQLNQLYKFFHLVYQMRLS
jgi:hypothetical protein